MLLMLAFLLLSASILTGYGATVHFLLRKYVPSQGISPTLSDLLVSGLLLATLLSSFIVLIFPLTDLVKFVFSVGGLSGLLLIPALNLPKNKPVGWKTYVMLLYLLLASSIIIYKASSPAELYDEGVQYLSLMHMFESKGVVKGVSNFYPHLALNSNWHLLVAMFDFNWLFKRPMYELNCTVALLLVVLGAEGLIGLFNDKLHLADTAALLAPLLIYRNQVTGAGTDLVVYAIGMWVLLKMLRIIVNNAVARSSIIMIGVVPILLLTIKLTSISFGIISLFICLSLVTTRQYRAFSVLCLCSGALLFTWVARNAMISGYLLPALEIGALPVKWQMSNHALLILNNFSQFGIFAPHQTYSVQRITDWFFSFNSANKLLLLISFGTTFLYVITALVLAFRRSITLLSAGFLTSLTVSFMVWFFTVTEFRYASLTHHFNTLLSVAVVVLLVNDFIPKVIKPLLVAISAMGLFVNLFKTVEEYPCIQKIAIFPTSNPIVRHKKLIVNGWEINQPVEYVFDNNTCGTYSSAVLKEAQKQSRPACWDTPFPCPSNENNNYIFKDGMVTYHP